MGCGYGFGGNCCWWIIILILLFVCCGNGCGGNCGCDNGCGCNNGCGCGCNNCGGFSNFANNGSWSWIWWIIIFVIFLGIIFGFSGNGWC